MFLLDVSMFTVVVGMNASIRNSNTSPFNTEDHHEEAMAYTSDASVPIVTFQVAKHATPLKGEPASKARNKIAIEVATKLAWEAATKSMATKAAVN
jgi:hypothetical protein